MQKFLFLLVFSLSIAKLSAQPTIEWQRSLGGSQYDQARSIQQTSDGGYIVTGRTSSEDGEVVGFHGIVDFWVVKLNNSGAIQWEKAIGGGSHDWPYSLRRTNDGGYIVAGLTESNNGDVSGYHGGTDAWVVKLNELGAIEWQKCLGGTGWDEAWSIELTEDGGYIMSGLSSSDDGDALGNQGGSLNYWVVKLDNIGLIQWQKSFGGSSEDVALSCRQTSDGGYILTGYANSNDGDVLNGTGGVNFWVIKLNNLGIIEWQHALGGTGWDVGSDIHETNDGYVACGYTASIDGDISGYQGGFDYWIVKLNKGGTLIWQKTLGGSNVDYARSMIQTNDGNYVVVGEVKSTDGDVEGNNGILVVWVVKLSESGEVLWKKTLGGTQGDGAYCINQTADDGYIIGGYSWSNDGDVSGNHGKADFWVVKLSPETVGLEEISDPPASALEIYPNPARETISFRIALEDPTLNLVISDLLGREIDRQTIPNGGQVDVSSLPNGLYLITVKDTKGRCFSGKFGKG